MERMKHVLTVLDSFEELFCPILPASAEPDRDTKFVRPILHEFKSRLLCFLLFY